jgi:hypothetical protein
MRTTVVFWVRIPMRTMPLMLSISQDVSSIFSSLILEISLAAVLTVLLLGTSTNQITGKIASSTLTLTVTILLFLSQ